VNARNAPRSDVGNPSYAWADRCREWMALADEVDRRGLKQPVLQREGGACHENLIPDREILSACLDLLLQIISHLEGKTKSIILTTTTKKKICIVSSEHSDSAVLPGRAIEG